MRQLTWIFWFALIPLCILAACSSPSSSSQDGEQIRQYKSKAGDFTLHIPNSWEGKVEIEETEERVVFSHVANKPGGVLFIIQTWSREKWDAEGEELTQIIHLSKLGEQDGRIYSFATPTDVQYDPEDEAKKQEYLELFQDVEAIKASFALHRE